jgi:protein arginine N-methyltransferase 1
MPSKAEDEPVELLDLAALRASTKCAAPLEGGESSLHSQDYADFNQEYFEQTFEHEKMLADKRRMDFYHSVVTRAVKEARIRSAKMSLSDTSKVELHGSVERAVVLDVGTGTGVLACWAAKAGAETVYAVDHSPKTLEMAARLAEASNCTVDFLCGHTSNIDLPEKVNLIVHEQIGDVLFDECMVRTIADVRDRFLKKGGRICPARFSLFIEPVKLDDDRHVPMMRNIKSHGLDFSCLAALACPASQAEEPGYFHFRSSDPSLVSQVLSSPEPAMQIDLHTITQAGLDVMSLNFARRIEHAGRLDALAVWFECEADGERGGKERITSGPFDNRCSHWGYRLLRCPKMDLQEGETLEIELVIDRAGETDDERAVEDGEKDEAHDEDDEEDDEGDGEEECGQGATWEDLNSWRWTVSRRKGCRTSKRQKVY